MSIFRHRRAQILALRSIPNYNLTANTGSFSRAVMRTRYGSSVLIQPRLSLCRRRISQTKSSTRLLSMFQPLREMPPHPITTIMSPPFTRRASRSLRTEKLFTRLIISATRSASSLTFGTRERSSVLICAGRDRSNLFIPMT